MLYKLHYWLTEAGLNAANLLMGVFMRTYTDASAAEIGCLFMIMPMTGAIFRPIICSYADRNQSHRKCLAWCFAFTSLSYVPFIIVPFLGPQFYEVHPRLCWYTLVSLKVFGDIFFGGGMSIGDSLAINYAARVGVEFTVYRIWATISWMVFGVIVGHVNEVSFLPKYTPGFMILCFSLALNIIVIYIWPEEYFKMVPTDLTEKIDPSLSAQAGDNNVYQTKRKVTGLATMTRSLMPKGEIWAQAKPKLIALFTFGLIRIEKSKEVPKKVEHKEPSTLVPPVTRMLPINALPGSGYLGRNSISAISVVSSNSIRLRKMDQATDENSQVCKDESYVMDEKTQLKIFVMLVKRDPRIPIYLTFFFFAGMTSAPINFFFISLSELCHETGECDFSRLGGFLQVSMALLETLVFIYIRDIRGHLGRVTLIIIAFALVGIMYLFYGTIWTSVSPYYSLLFESLWGISYAHFACLMAEMGHLFANEVEFILDELKERQIIEKEADQERVKVALSSTMQAIIATLLEGLGQGIGALLFGILIDKTSYRTLWLTVSIGSFIVMSVGIIANTLDSIFDFGLGLDVKAVREKRRKLQELAAKEEIQVKAS